MTFCYSIKNWDKHFENSESRKIKSLTWLPVKNKHDGKGYRRVAQHPKSEQVFCAWNLIIQVASKMPLRGLLRDDDGPLTASDLSDKTGFRPGIFELAFEVLTDPRIGWLIKEKLDLVPERPGVHGDVGIEQNGMEQNGMEDSPPPKSLQEKGSGEKPTAPVIQEAPLPEIPTEDQAVVMTMNAGIAEDFARYVYKTWVSYGGKNAASVPRTWMEQVTTRWAREQTEWKNGTHTGQRTGKANRKPNSRNVGVAGSAADKTRDVQAVLARQNQTYSHETT